MNTHILKKVDLNEKVYPIWSLSSLMTQGISVKFHLAGNSRLILQSAVRILFCRESGLELHENSVFFFISGIYVPPCYSIHR